MIDVVPQRFMDTAAIPWKFSGIRFTEGKPVVTSGSLRDLPEDDPGTAIWWLGSQALSYRRGVPTGDALSETYTTSTRDAYAEATADSTQVDYEMAQLAAAAQAGDGSAFVAIQQAMDWSRRPPPDFIRAAQLALAAGAHHAARILSAQGAERYPGDRELQKYARILAPPKVIRRALPPHPTLKANRDWLMSKGNQYRGQWVALRNGELLTVAGSLKSLVDEIGDTTGILVTKVF